MYDVPRAVKFIETGSRKGGASGWARGGEFMPNGIKVGTRAMTKLWSSVSQQCEGISVSEMCA